MIHLIFGLGFDREVWSGPITSDSAVIGLKRVGEAGFVDVLETQLGIKQPSVPSTKRLLSYLKALKEADTGKRFYSKSYSNDPVGVAERLLQVRDSLIKASWSGFEIPGLIKVNDLSAVESKFQDCSGLADRSFRVLAALERRTQLQAIRTVTVVERPERFSSLHRSILVRLEQIGVTVEYAVPAVVPVSEVGCDIQSLIGLRSNQVAPRSDGSVCYLTGKDPWESARAVSAWLAIQAPESLVRTVVIAPDQNRSILRAALLERGIAFGGGSSVVSYGRPALQLLILTLSLTWAPKDPSIALALLTLKGTPVPSELRSRMIRSLETSKAVGGIIWNQELKKGIAEWRACATTEEEHRKIDLAEARVTEWFSGASFERESGIPTAEVLAVCSRVSRWLRRASFQGDPSYREAANIADQLAEMAMLLKDEKVTEERLFQLLMDSVGNGLTSGGLQAEAKGVRVVRSPSEVQAEADVVIWWDFNFSTSRASKESFFTIDEQEKLQNAGVKWLDAQQEAVLRATSWLAPFLAAKNKILLVGSQFDAQGSIESPHPVLDEILPKTAKREWLQAIHVQLDQPDLPATKSFLKEVGAELMPAEPHSFVQRENWVAPRGVLKLRPVESATSLEKLFGCDLAYAFRYGVGLDGPYSASLVIDNSTYGTITHMVIAEVFPVGDPPQPDDAARLAKKILKEVVPHQAPVLLSKDQTSNLAKLEWVVTEATRSYAGFLNANKMKIVGVEMKIAESIRKFADVSIGGALDHVLKDEHGNTVIIDHKWGDHAYKARDLKDGKSLQLSLYSMMVNEGHNPIVAYHMVEHRRILVLNKEYKRSTKVSGPDTSDILEDAEGILKAKAASMRDGNLQAQGLQDGNDKERWKAQCNFCDYNKICGRAWKVGA